MKRYAVLLSGLVLALTACTSGGHSPRATHSPSPSAPTTFTGSNTGLGGGLGRPGCKPATPLDRGAGFPEVEGTSDHLHMWGLIMVDGSDDPIRVNEQVKIVWRITGSGALTLTTTDPGGTAHPLQWGPDQHLSSEYHRPGQEWGAGYLFDEPGCWALGATRGTASAVVWLDIAS